MRNYFEHNELDIVYLDNVNLKVHIYYICVVLLLNLISLIIQYCLIAWKFPKLCSFKYKNQDFLYLKIKLISWMLSLVFIAVPIFQTSFFISIYILQCLYYVFRIQILLVKSLLVCEFESCFNHQKSFSFYVNLGIQSVFLISATKNLKLP